MEKEYNEKRKQPMKRVQCDWKGIRSLCATVKVYFDFALSHMGML